MGDTKVAFKNLNSAKGHTVKNKSHSWPPVPQFLSLDVKTELPTSPQFTAYVNKALLLFCLYYLTILWPRQIKGLFVIGTF